jgi:hypothetical protein
LVVLLLALVGGFAFVAPGSAWATTGHAFAGAFGGGGDGDGKFSESQGNGPAGVAVMASTGEVFTADMGQGATGPAPRVQRFSADGVFQSAFPLTNIPENGGMTSVAVDPAGFGAVYVSTGFNGGTILVNKYSASGVFAYSLGFSGSGVVQGAGAQVAVDPVDGMVYVTATRESDGAQVIASFDQTTGVYLGSFDGSDGSPDGGFWCQPTSLAIDGSHRIYALDPCKNGAPRVDQYSAAGTWGATIDDGVNLGVPSAVAADPVSDEVYVSETGSVGLLITHFTAGGAAPVYTFDASDVGGVRAMAVSGLGTVYTSDASRAFVERFTRFEGPSVVTGDAPAETVETRSAVVEGTVDPEGVESTYHFEYGLDEKYGSRTEGETAVGGGSDPVAASSALSGLKPNRTYHYRIVGSNASGSIAGADRTFTTLPSPPDVDGTSPAGSSPAFASAIGPRSVRLHGTVNPNSSNPARWYLEYGTTTAYGSTKVDPDSEGNDRCVFVCGGDDIPVIASVSGLEPGTTYHFRVVAGAGLDFPLADPQNGADQTFTTAPAAGGGASGVTTRRATLTGTIDPHGEDTSYHFNYGPTSSYGSRTPEVGAGAGDGDEQVSQGISGLLPDRTYHVQVVATSDNGVVRYGGDGVFRTAPAPTAVAISPIGVSTDAATLVGEADTHGLAGSYRFDVSSLDSSYQSSTVERAVSGHALAEQVSVAVDGLPAGERFVVALVVTSNDSTRVSDPVTFATAAVPTVFPPPPAGDGKGSYGCTAPRLDSYDAKPKPGETITVNGRDLGASGTVVLGDRSLVPAAWSAGRFKLEIPDDASGTLGLTVNCGQRSNTIAIAIFKKPSSRFSIANTTVKGSRATLSVKVAGPGKLTSSATNAKPGRVTVKKARGAKLVVKLNRAGIRALRKSRTGRLKVPVRVRYLPVGGRASIKAVTVTFNRTAGR